MRALLDTHAFLWWIAGDDRLSDRASRTIADSGNELLVSAASIWEIAIKARLGRLRSFPIITATPSTGCWWLRRKSRGWR